MADAIVNIISGFLGAGKTTAIINLLLCNNTGEKWAVIVNEYGKVPIDGDTIRSESTGARIYDVTGGCVCCSAKSYFGDTLRMVTESAKFSRIIVEPSGLGGIDMVTEIVRNVPGLLLSPVICLVDIAWVNHPRFRLNPVYQAQVRKSDVVIFSKCDLIAEPSNLETSIRIFSKQFPEVFFYAPGTSLSDLIPEDDGIGNRSEKTSPSDKFDKNLTDINFRNMVYECEAERIIDTDRIEQALQKYPGILRAKGYIITDNGWFLVNYTLSGCSFIPCEPKERNQLIVISDRLVSGHDALFIPFLNKSVG